jgi:hypothetical protein
MRPNMPSKFVVSTESLAYKFVFFVWKLKDITNRIVHIWVVSLRYALDDVFVNLPIGRIAMGTSANLQFREK